MIEKEISSLLLQTGSGQSGGFILWLPLIFIVGVFYFLLIMPQQMRQKRWQQMVNDLKNGDKIITGGGIRGTIISIKDDSVTLRVPPDNLRLEVAKSSVVSVAREDEIATSK